ncbi:MAG: hypothetical protein JST28_17315 [Acidobacteria bacterium]|nr:hypothetical protein [Acidobacteriota bacterium]
MKALTLLTGSFLALALNAIAVAQTVRPVISELGNPAKGRVEYVNDGLTPLNVVLEARSFTVSEKGELSYRPLDPDIHLKLSATSFRIQPKQTYYVFYEASAAPAPRWFVIYASFSGFAFRTEQGMNVRLQLPHTVYLLPKQRAEKADVHVVRAELDDAGSKVLLEVENTGNDFGRVLQTQLANGRKKQDAPGFPIFPHSRRILEVPLDVKADRDSFPTELSLLFDNFKIEEKLKTKSSSDLQLASASPSSTGSAGEKR